MSCQVLHRCEQKSSERPLAIAPSCSGEIRHPWKRPTPGRCGISHCHAEHRAIGALRPLALSFGAEAAAMAEDPAVAPQRLASALRPGLLRMMGKPLTSSWFPSRPGQLQDQK